MFSGWKTVGGFLSHEGGGGQRRFDICHKKVVFLNEGFPYQIDSECPEVDFKQNFKKSKFFCKAETIFINA